MNAEILVLSDNVRRARLDLLGLVPRCVTRPDALRLAKAARELAQEFELLALQADARWLAIDGEEMAQFRAKWGPSYPDIGEGV